MWVQGEEWVKGAVNYDEDLHFSSYYLRASCSPVTAPHYPGYSGLVASYEGFNETYYLASAECRASAAVIVKRAVRNPRWLPRVLQEIQRRSDALGGIFPRDTSSSTLARLSGPALLSLYRRHDTRQRALYVHARLPEALDRGVSYFTDYITEYLRGRGLSSAACAEAFAAIAEPVAPSVLSQEIFEFDEIVRFARGRPAAVLPAAEGSGRLRMLVDPELLRRLDAHRKKWQFLAYHGYGRRELTTLDQYVNRFLEESRRLTAGPAGADLATRCAQARKARRALWRRLKVDDAHRVLFELYPEIGAVKLYRRYAQLRNFYYLDLLLAEVARRLNVSERTVRCMLPEEVVAAVGAGRQVSRSIRKRLDGCVYAFVDGQEHVATGDEAEELRGLFRGRPSSAGDSNILHGVAACRGKAAGPCRVIIRGDDCQGSFDSGTILVSESTDPDLVRFLRRAGGVLTEQGGVTSHAAVICRELGVPTIIGVEGLLARVGDGDWVELDAERGTITMGRTADVTGAHPPSLPEPPEVIGAKAHNLGVVRSLGFRVPDYVVLSYDEVRRAAGRRDRGLVRRLLSGLDVSNGDRLAVRSSAVAEDRADGSCAGEFHSLLDVGRDELAAALREFVGSNRRGRNGNAYRGSVILQRMVHADCAGVCLTRDGRAGQGAGVIVELAAGGNQGVTGGTVRPDRLVVDRLTGDILHEERRSAGLRRQSIDVAALVQEFLRLEARFGQPLDIEWAVENRELYILQVRPIVNHAVPSRKHSGV
jgi:phosphohistidine swiveling domain-containing protein